MSFLQMFCERWPVFHCGDVHFWCLRWYVHDTLRFVEFYTKYQEQGSQMSDEQADVVKARDIHAIRLLSLSHAISLTSALPWGMWRNRNPSEAHVKVTGKSKFRSPLATGTDASTEGHIPSLGQRSKWKALKERILRSSLEMQPTFCFHFSTICQGIGSG